MASHRASARPVRAGALRAVALDVAKTISQKLSAKGATQTRRRRYRTVLARRNFCLNRIVKCCVCAELGMSKEGASFASHNRRRKLLDGQLCTSGLEKNAQELLS